MFDWLENLIFPERASTVAGEVDALYTFLLTVAGFFTLLIYVLVIVFIIKYRRSRRPRAEQVESSLALELIWSIIPLILAMIIFVWGAKLYWQIYSVPPEAAESQIYVVGKQWMWKIHHPEGPREINQLHVPVGRPTKLVMTSEDVIHSFYVPAFRIKQDVLPGRYVQLWFEATKVGIYHLFCAEYCGTDHAKMVGSIIVMEPAQYQEWLRAGETTPSMAGAGQQLYVQLGCQSCHTGEPGAASPQLLGRYGRPVALRSGKTVTMSEAYIRESLINPGREIAAGYEAVMPPYQGLISEEGLLQIIEFLKTGPLAPAADTQPVDK